MEAKTWMNAQLIKRCCKDGAYIINGYDEALIGVSDSMVPIYDYYRLVDAAAKRYGMDQEMAAAYIDANVLRGLPDDKSSGPVINYGFRGNLDMRYPRDETTEASEASVQAGT